MRRDQETIPVPVGDLPTTTSIARRAPALMPASFDEASDLARRLSPSALLPAPLRGKEPEIFMTILAGQELGMSPMVALRAFHVIEGVPRLSADAMVAVVMGSGLCEFFRPVEQTAETSTWETKRRGSSEIQRYTYTMAQQKRIGFREGSGWTRYPERMLSARAKSFLARDVYGDVLAGVPCLEDADDATGMSEAQKAGAMETLAAVVTSSAAEQPATAPPPMSLTEEDEAAIGLIVEALKDSDRAGLLSMRESLAKEASAVRQAAEPHLYRALIRAASTAAELKQVASDLRDHPSIKEAVRADYKARLDQLNPRTGGGPT